LTILPRHGAKICQSYLPFNMTPSWGRSERRPSRIRSIIIKATIDPIDLAFDHGLPRLYNKQSPPGESEARPGRHLVRAPPSFASF
jgi:hypothetical protein